MANLVKDALQRPMRTALGSQIITDEPLGFIWSLEDQKASSQHQVSIRVASGWPSLVDDEMYEDGERAFLEWEAWTQAVKEMENEDLMDWEECRAAYGVGNEVIP